MVSELFRIECLMRRFGDQATLAHVYKELLGDKKLISKIDTEEVK